MTICVVSLGIAVSKGQGYQALKKVWYQKLRDSGFVDIERIHEESGNNKPCLGGVTQSNILQTWSEEAQEYYRLAEQHLGQLDRDREAQLLTAVNKLVRDIWALYSEGHSRPEIELLMKLTSHVVYYTVKWQESRMLGRKYDGPIPKRALSKPRGRHKLGYNRPQETESPSQIIELSTGVSRPQQKGE